MNEERFEKWNDNSCKVKDNQEDTLLDCCRKEKKEWW